MELNKWFNFVLNFLKICYNCFIKKGGYMSENANNKRWYDKDPILKEALELLRLSPDETKSEAAEFMLQLQEQVAGEVIEHVYDIINTYQGKGNRWYDNDPMMLKAVELLRNAPPKVQRVAALKLLIALEQKTFEGVEI